jgi:pimeloyl-ACP methyl ester carboxylesterase
VPRPGSGPRAQPAPSQAARRGRAAAAACCLAAIAAPASGAEALKPCRVAGIRNEVQCGVLQRALDPARPDAARIEVHYVVVPAMARRKLPDPVFMLAGGPGQSAISLAPSAMALFTRLNNRRDIVFVDQRGTGRSAPLLCEDTRHRPLAEQADPQQQVRQVLECRDQLKALPHGDLRFFTTTLAMQDLDAVRRQLGAERINLVGASYGTRAALDYARQFPGALRRSVLDGVAPPDMVLPVSTSTDAQAAFDALLAACETEPACRQAHPALRAEWAGLLKGLPRTVTVAHPLSGRPETFAFTREMLLAAVRGPLYVPSMAAALPQAIGDAAQGRFEALLGLGSLLSARKATALAMGMHFSVVCAEDAPRMAQASDVPGRDFGGEFATLYQRVCATWPQGQVAAAFYHLRVSESPVLLLSGGIDPATPPRHAQRVAQALGPNALHVVVPQAGHGVMGLGCARDLVFRFIDAAQNKDALALDATCATGIPRPPAFQPLRLERTP